MVRASEDDWLAASWEPVGPEETRTRVFVYVGTQQTSTAAVDFLAIERTLNGDLPRPCLGRRSWISRPGSWTPMGRAPRR